MLRMNRQGFTLIELMVVIVIIGVLASLAIPRFSEASAKAKAAEAPRVLASYESAYLAANAEIAQEEDAGIPLSDLVFEVPKDSKWWTYAGMDKEAKTYDAEQTELTALAESKGMSVISAVTLKTSFSDDDDCFKHEATGGVANAALTALQAAKKMVPNFDNSKGCPATTEFK